MFESVTMNALVSALDGLSARQRATADNVANVNTPNFRANTVSFEEALATSVRRGEGTVAATASRSLEPTNLEGNNVNLDKETVSSEDTALKYQYATQAINGQFSSIRTALRSN